MSEQMGQYPEPEDIAAETAAETLEDERQGETESISQPVLQQERGGVAWCELFGKVQDEAGQFHLVKINLTNRGENAEQALRGLLQCLSVARSEFHMLPYMPTIPMPVAPVLSVPVAVASCATTPPPPGAAPVSTPPAQASNEPASGTFLIVKEVVAPRQDGKVEVSLFAQGHQYADLKMIGEPEKIAAMFGVGWQAAHFQAIATYNVSLKVAWQNSANLNKNGKPYKNVSAINPG